jgi:electron transport complex protein RnfA
MGDLTRIFVSAALINNFVLAYFVGLCPFFGVSKKVPTAARMGGAVTFVMVLTATAVSFLNAYVLPVAPYLRLISYIVVIASLVQIVEMVVKKTSPALFRALGIYLPLITTNCAILYLALFQYARGYGFLEGIAFALGAGAGFTLALVLMASIRQRSETASVPAIAREMGLAMIIAGSLSMAFMGFAGLLSAGG